MLNTLSREYSFPSPIVNGRLALPYWLKRVDPDRFDPPEAAIVDADGTRMSRPAGA